MKNHRTRETVVRYMALIVFFLLIGVSGFSDPPKNGHDGKENNIVQAEKGINVVRSGVFNGFTMDKVYIDSIGLKLAEDIAYYSEEGDKISRNIFRNSCLIKFVLNAQREVVIIQMNEPSLKKSW
ncbi:MAG: hypothetical protein M0Z56_11320 [Desulfobacteraceae bacterium]|nr:hypothetical protein [Desulfobacteraceae bacterium]